MSDYYFQAVLCIGILIYYLTTRHNNLSLPGFTFDPRTGNTTVTYLAGKQTLTGILGMEYDLQSHMSRPCEENSTAFCYIWDGVAKLNITTTLKVGNDDENLLNKNHHHHHHHSQSQCYTIHWTSLDEDLHPYDCYDFGDSSWYGGGELFTDRWPLNKVSMDIVPFVSYDVGLKQKNFGSVLERFWFSSNGFGIFVDDKSPLHVGYPDGKKLCLKSAYTPPYTNHNALNTELSYTLCSTKHVISIHQKMSHDFIPPPQGIPDENMFKTLIWSTWVRYKTEVSEEKVLDFAKEILDHNFQSPQRIEIDDKYTTHYGDYSFDAVKFPNATGMISTLHSLGFDVTSWVMPFCDQDAKAYREGRENGYFVLTNDHTTVPGMVQWWNGMSAVIDFTNPDAVAWFYQRLHDDLTTLGMDSFKFDAGEIQYLPDNFKLHTPSFNPNHYSTLYMNSTLQHSNNMLEVRAGYKTQHLPVFVRMMDKDSVWTGQRGLDTVIPTALLFGILGYPYVLPDMIGGNAYDETGIGAGDMPEKELYIRWMQLTTFLPCMQFSVPPWDYGADVMDLLQNKLLLIRKNFVTPTLIKIAKESVQQRKANPLIRPIWWSNPDNPLTFDVDDQFLIGNEILVAPVLKQGARSRDIVLPSGTWYDANTAEIYHSTKTPIIRDYPADLMTVPFFTLMN